MSFLSDTWDGLVTRLFGRVRVRVTMAPDGPRAAVRGRVPGPPPDRIARAVLECAPPGAGVLDVFRDGRRLRVRARGGLDGAFEQRVRNVLGNL